MDIRPGSRSRTRSSTTPRLKNRSNSLSKPSENGLDPDVLTPTCGRDHQHITIEITDNDTANIALDAPEEVTEGQPIKLGLGPRPNVNCPVQFPFTATVTVTGDPADLKDTPSMSETLKLTWCQDPDEVKIQNEDSTTSCTRLADNRPHGPAGRPEGDLHHRDPQVLRQPGQPAHPGAEVRNRPSSRTSRTTRPPATASSPATPWSARP